MRLSACKSGVPARDRTCLYHLNLSSRKRNAEIVPSPPPLVLFWEPPCRVRSTHSRAFAEIYGISMRLCDLHTTRLPSIEPRVIYVAIEPNLAPARCPTNINVLICFVC